MRDLRRLAWAAAIGLAASTPAFAQQATTATPGGNIGTPTTQTVPGSTTSVGSNSVGSSSIPGSSSTPQSTFTAASQLQPPSKTNTNTNSVIKDPILGKTYGSVYYQGSVPSSVPNGSPGGFGSTIYQSTGTTGGRGATGTGQGGRAGAASSSVNTSDPGGILVPLPRQIAYASQIHFKLPPGNPLPQLQSDLRGSIDRVPNTMLANPAGVQVELAGRTVVLRGSVRDQDESHLVEGLVRLTPGVGAIKNELTFPK